MIAPTTFDAACLYAHHGLHTIPVGADKRPAIDSWQTDGSIDLAQLATWFRDADRNIGIVMGLSSLITVDIDPRNGGDETFRLRVTELGELPATVTADTGGGGIHYVFRAPASTENLVGKLGRGVDLLHGGRQILVEPSIHPSGGRYQWRAGHAPGEIEFATLPNAWLEFATRPAQSERAKPSGPATGESIFDALATLNQRYVLQCLSGASIVNGERFEFKRTRNGRWNVLVDRGDGPEGTSNFIASDGTIGAHSTGGKKDGGPTVSTWLRWYGADDKKIRAALVEHVPELGRWERDRIDRQRAAATKQQGASQAAAEEVAPTDTKAPVEEREKRRTEITISTDQSATVDAAEAALQALGGVYVRARTLVQVVRDRSESHGLAYPEGTPVITRIGRERLRELCGRAATWLSVSATAKGKLVSREVQCPPWVAVTLEQRQEWRLPTLDRVSDAPVFRVDGTLHDRPGYDVATRTIYDPGSVRYPPIPPTPTLDDARRAIGLLVEPVCDVPFVAASDRAAWASLVLTLIARSAIDGPTPMFTVRAPVPGAGKGLALDVAATIATGRSAPKRPPATSDEELRKALMAYALEAPALVALDNVDGVLGSPTLAMVLTAGTISDRLLGVSESRTVPVRYVLAATGNNMQLRGDLGRRVVPIDIDPRTEHPEDRGGFRYPDLLDHVRHHRPELVAATLTILRAFVVAGRPAHGRSTLGSYEAWDRLVRAAVVWASGDDPLVGLQRIRDEGDEDRDRLRALLATWHATFDSMPTTVADAIRKAKDTPELHDAMASYCRAGVEARTLGVALRRLKGRICDGRQLTNEPGRAGSVRWSVIEVES